MRKLIFNGYSADFDRLRLLINELSKHGISTSTVNKVRQSSFDIRRLNVLVSTVLPLIHAAMNNNEVTVAQQCRVCNKNFTVQCDRRSIDISCGTVGCFNFSIEGFDS